MLRIRELRLENNLTQKDVAYQLNISHIKKPRINHIKTVSEPYKKTTPDRSVKSGRAHL